MSPFLVLPRALAKPLRWPADSARRARHNAYAANAALAVRRAEREEVEQFLEQHGTPGRGHAERLPQGVLDGTDLRLPQPRTVR